MGGGRLTIRLRVQLGHAGRPVAEHDASRLDADLTPQLRRGSVSELVGVPVLNMGSLAGSADRMAQATGCIQFARQSRVTGLAAPFPSVGGPIVPRRSGTVGIGPSGDLGRLANPCRRLSRLKQERLGVGPDECMARNPKLVFGRMTGWGQEGPYSSAAGHDINYISLAGALAHFGRKDGPPTPPLNMVGDFGGGGMFLALGVVAAMLEATGSGQGQVVDTAMVDGSAILMTMFWSFKAMGLFDENARGSNLLDTGAHFYDVYECADGEYVSIGSIEPQFYAELMRLTGLEGDDDFARQMDQAHWPDLKARLTDVFASKTRDEWCSIMEHTDVCFAPVLTMSEAAEHPHNVAREMIVERGGVAQPAPAPRFSRTANELDQLPAHPGQHTLDVFTEWGVPADRVSSLSESGAIRQA